MKAKTLLTYVRSSISAHVITRVLIVSYFIALALGIVQGAELSKLASPFFDENLARQIMRAIVLTLSGMILFNVWRRPSALVLALVLFWASYITLYSGGLIGAFWRDLALIGGLILTADIAGYADAALAESLDKNDGGFDDQFVEDGLAKAPGAEQGDQFREDFDLARTS